MGIPAIKCEICGTWFSPVHSEQHCEEMKTLLDGWTDRFNRKKLLLREIIVAHRRYVLGETDDMGELDEAIRAAAEDAGYPWAVQKYSPKNS